VLASPEKIDDVSDYFNRRFNATGKSNLDGEKGIREMEADVVRGFEKLVQDYATLQLLKTQSQSIELVSTLQSLTLFRSPDGRQDDTPASQAMVVFPII
jgi:hypothetical protein